tara:strand:- start:361 stop:1593 length:1233 start_codon:yes stop_codon:yes gene_type:complete
MKVQSLPISDIKPYEQNPRKNNAAVAGVMRSIQEYGFQQPLVLDVNHEVVVGHTRLKAADALGMTEVPCVVAEGLTDEQVKAYRIMDNKSGEVAEWDYDLLKGEVYDLMELDFDLDLTGFSEVDLQELGLLDPEVNEGLVDEDEVPDAPANPTTVNGDVWLLGSHRLMCGDSTSFEDLSRLMDNRKADMWLSDPPYNVKYEGKTKEALTIQNDAMDDQDFRQFLTDAFSAADSVMKAGAVFYIWHADSEGYNFRGAAKDVGWHVRQCLIWKKHVMVMGRQDYHWKHEPCLYGWKAGSGHLWASDRKQTTILEFDRPMRSTDHPTMKPVELIEYQMLNNTKGADAVLDSFGGSGTTLIAAEKNGRECFTMEVDPKYCDVIIKRWEAYTGKEATHQYTGLTFSNVQKNTENG